MTISLFARPFIIALVLLVVGPSATGQTAGVLELSPTLPQPGDRVSAVYEPADHLGTPAAVALRARLRTPGGGAYDQEADTRTVATLHRDADGRYRGTFALPDSVVLALLAVASVDGSVVDTNTRQGWVLYARAPGGAPLRAALEAHVAEVEGYDSRTTIDVARRLAAAEPDDPSAWGPITKYSVLNPEGNGEPVDTLVARMVAFDRALRDAADPDPDRVHGLRRMARALGAVGGGPILDHWDEWVLEHAPAHPETVALRTFQAYLDHSADPAAQLDAFGEIWAGAGPGGQLTELGFSAAVESGDSHAARIWADRFREDRPTAFVRQRVARGLASLLDTRAEGLRLMRDEVERTLSTPADHRDLFETVADHQASTKEDAAWVQLDLGSALFQAGDAEAAVAPLRDASSVKSMPEVFDLLSRAHLATGDTLAAARARAFVAAAGGDDPETAVRLVPDGRWREFVESARSELVARAARSAGDDALPENIRLTTAGGEPVTLNEVIEGGAALVALHSRNCGFCVRDMPRLDELRRALEPDGVGVVVVTRDERSPAVVDSFRERGYTGPLHFDTADGVASAFQTSLVPQYFLVDSDGIVRYPFTSLDQIPAQVDALLAASTREP